MLVPISRSSATSGTGLPNSTRPTAWALNSAEYRFLVTGFIVAYSFISWSRIFAHFIFRAARFAPAHARGLRELRRAHWAALRHRPGDALGGTSARVLSLPAHRAPLRRQLAGHRPGGPARLLPRPPGERRAVEALGGAAGAPG